MNYAHCFVGICFDFITIPGFILLRWINFNSIKISNHMSNEVWDEIIYPFPNLNGVTIEVEFGIGLIISSHIL